MHASHALAHDVGLGQRPDRTAEFHGQLGNLTHGQVTQTVLTFLRDGHRFVLSISIVPQTDLS